MARGFRCTRLDRNVKHRMRATRPETCGQCDQKKLPNVYKSCLKMMSKEKLLFLTHLQNLPKNVGDFDKIILPKALKSCPKSNKLPNLVTLTTELFSGRRWGTGSAQQSNNYGIMSCMCCIIFGGQRKHNSCLLGPIQPSSPTAKELHAWTHLRARLATTFRYFFHECALD